MCLFVYRDEYYLQNGEPEEGTEEWLKWNEKLQRAIGRAEVIIAKQRHGPVGTVELFFNGELTQFDDLDKVHSL